MHSTCLNWNEIVILGDFNLSNVDWNESLEFDYYIPFGLIIRNWNYSMVFHHMNFNKLIRLKTTKLLIFSSDDLDCWAFFALVISLLQRIVIIINQRNLYTYLILRIPISIINAKLNLFDWICLDNFIFNHVLIYFYNYVFWI